MLCCLTLKKHFLFKATGIVRVTSVARMNSVCLPAVLPRPATAAPRRARAMPPPCADSGARRGLSGPAPRVARSSQRTQGILGFVHNTALD